MGHKRKANMKSMQPVKKARWTENKTDESLTMVKNESEPVGRNSPATNLKKDKKFANKFKANVTKRVENGAISQTVENKPLSNPEAINMKAKSPSNVKLLKHKSGYMTKLNDDKLPSKLSTNLKEKPSSETEVASVNDGKPSTFLPQKPSEVSCNWKDLIKSGKVVYNGRQTSLKKKSTEETSKKIDSEKSNDIWFDGVDEILLETGKEKEPMENAKHKDSLVKPKAFEGLTKIIGIDCEMVGIGWEGKDSMLARVSIVNHFGQCLYDKFVKPMEKVTDYRTSVSGVRPSDIKNGEDFKTVQMEVSNILNGRILVGHAIQNDLKVLFLDHPRKNIRDTSRYKPFRVLCKGGRPSLKKLTEKLLGVKIQDGEHNSVQDAQAAMRLYTMHRKEWEKALKRKNRN